MAGVILKDMVKRFGKTEVLHGINLEISDGEFIVLVGPSGCGKSTVLKSINRMNDLIRGFRFEGRVMFHGMDIYDKKVDPVSVRRNIGMVFQQPNPFSMSIYDNVAFGLEMRGIDKATRYAIAREWIDLRAGSQRVCVDAGVRSGDFEPRTVGN